MCHPLTALRLPLCDEPLAASSSARGASTSKRWYVLSSQEKKTSIRFRLYLIITTNKDAGHAFPLPP